MRKLFRSLLAALLVIALLCGLTACSNTEEAPAADASVQTAVDSSLPFAGTTLTVFNWFDYIDPAVIDMFEEETGATVQYVNFTTVEEMYAKIEAGAATYDVVFPSDYMIERMITADMLAPLNFENIPNADGIMDWMKTADYDPTFSYSVPYLWGTVGILYNTEMVHGEINSWDVLFSDEYAQDVIMISSMRDTIAVALKELGYSLNSRNPEELYAARDLLVHQKQSGIPCGYLLDEVKDKMVGNEAALSVVYSGDAYYAMDKNEALSYVVPNEGSNVWIDGMCIPKNSPNKECAEAFINFLCRDDVAQMNFDYVYYPTPIQSVADALKEDDPDLYAVMIPSDEVIARCEFFHDVLDAMDLYESVWMAVRSARRAN